MKALPYPRRLVLELVQKNVVFLALVVIQEHRARSIHLTNDRLLLFIRETNVRRLDPDGTWCDLDSDSIVDLVGDAVPNDSGIFRIKTCLVLRLKFISAVVRPSGVADRIGLLGCNTFYEVLNVSRTASSEQIRENSRVLLLRLHSDKPLPSDSSSLCSQKWSE